MRGKNARGALGKASGKWLERNYCSTLWIIIKHSTRTKTPIFFFACLTFRPSLLSSWQRAVVLQQRCQPLEISNLEIFFRTSPPPPPPPDRVRRCDLSPGNLFFFFGPPNSPPPPPHEQFRGKNMDLSVKDLNWLNTHPIRLSYIGVTRKKLSYFCLQRTTRITQEIEARNHNTSRKSEIRKRDDFGILEHMELES